MTELADQVRRMQDEVLDRAQAWTESHARELLDEAARPLDRLLHELGVGDAFAALDERTRRQLESVLEEVRAKVVDVAEGLRGGPPRVVVEQLHALAVDLEVARREGREPS